MFENNRISKENLNSLLKNTRELLEEINSPKREYNLLQKIDDLNEALKPLLQYFYDQEEDDSIGLFTISFGLKAGLQSLESHIKPTEVKTDKYIFKVPSFFNSPPKTKILENTQQTITHLKSSSNLLEGWLENKGWLEQKELKQLKH